MTEPGLLPQTSDYTMAGYFGDKTVCIVDHGLFSHLAEVLVGSFARILYFSHWQQAFPRSNSLLPGSGFDGVERIDEIWSHIDAIDLFIFPDIFDGPLQVYLRNMGKRVWGSGLAERLETRRSDSKKWLRQIGLPVGPYRALNGTAELRRHLQLHDDQFVKNNTRGDMETFHAETYDIIEPRLDELDYQLGAKKDFTEFVVEDPIDAKVECGFDGFTIDGQFPGESLFGVETKDSGYVGEVVLGGTLPGAVSFVNQKLSPLFKQLNYRGFWSSEIRVSRDGTPYLIDPCCRMASPPGELYAYLIENLPEVIWEGAGGNLVQPRWKFRWGAQLILRSAWAETGWQPIEFDPALREHVKLHYGARLGGRDYYVPQNIPMPEIGAVVAGGDTKEQAIRNVTKIAEQIRGYDIKFDVGALEKASEGMEALRAA